jgi:tryptophan synthase beta subunit
VPANYLLGSRTLMQMQSNAIGYAKFYSRSHDAVIRVYDDAGNAIDTHEHAAISKSGDYSPLGGSSSKIAQKP